MAARLLPRLLRAERGVTAIEFAFALPLLLGVVGYGVEIANLALTHLRISQYALYLADNASRVGLTTNLNTTQLREADVNDIFQGLRLQSKNLKLTTYGRVTLSSLEAQSNGTQLLHWQRCVGMKSGTGYDTSYGNAGAGTGGRTVTNMGDTWSPVTAPTVPTPGGVMFVEINYDYQPLFGRTYVSAQKLHYVASYLVRDSRDFSVGVTNPATAQTASSCTAYTT